MAIENNTPQNVEAVEALAQSLAEDEGVGEAFRADDLFSVAGLRLGFLHRAQGILSHLEGQGWVLQSGQARVRCS